MARFKLKPWGRYKLSVIDVDGWEIGLMVTVAPSEDIARAIGRIWANHYGFCLGTKIVVQKTDEVTGTFETLDK